MAQPKKSATTATTATTATPRFTAEERAAMKERALEQKSTDGLTALLEKIAFFPEAERAMATTLHELVMAVAPDLEPRTYYGMPAWARDGKVLCFFQNASKFKVRYSTLGFQDNARLDDGDLWPTAYALTALTPETEERIRALLTRAVS